MAKVKNIVTPEYLKKSAELMGNIKAKTYEMMRVGAGSKVLDVGCGPGMDVVPMAKIVGKTGSVTGLDIDEVMLEKGREYALQEGVSDITHFMTGDVGKLPFEDNTFDAVRAERLLQVLPDSYNPDQVVGELIRVTKQGGYIGLADSDWASVSVDMEDTDLERRLMSFFTHTMRPNGYAGRQLFRLCKSHGLKNVEIQPIPLMVFDYELTPFGNWLTDTALEHNVISPQEADMWLKEVEKRTTAGEFYYCVNFILISGKK